MDISTLQNLNPLDPAGFEQIQDSVEDVLSSENMSYAEEALEFLNELLQKHGEEIESKSPDFYDVYQSLWVRLAFTTFPILESNDQDNLLKSRILFAVQKEYDPSKLINVFFDLYQSDEYIKTNFKSFSKALEQNNEPFGTTPIIIEGKKMMPSIKYWIMDYSKFPSKVSKRGNVERLNYVNQSQNARALTQVYKQQLLRVLKFYDDLINAERPLNKRRPVEETRRAPSAPVIAPQPATPKPSMDFTPPVIKPVAPVAPQPAIIQKPKIDIQKKLEELKDRRQNAS